MTVPMNLPPLAPQLEIGGVAPNQSIEPWAFYDTFVGDFVAGNDPAADKTLVLSDTSLASRYKVGMPICIGGSIVATVKELAAPIDDPQTLVVNVIYGFGLTANTLGSVCPCGPQVYIAPTAAAMFDSIADATSFTIPSGANLAQLVLANGGWVEANMYVFVLGAGWFKVITVNGDGKTLAVTHGDYINYNAAGGVTVVAGTPCWPEFPLAGAKLSASDFKITTPSGVGSALIELLAPAATKIGINDPGQNGVKMEWGEIALANARLVAATGITTVWQKAPGLTSPAFVTAFSAPPAVMFFAAETDTEGTTDENLIYYKFAPRTISVSGFDVWASAPYAVGAAATAKLKWLAIGV